MLTEIDRLSILLETCLSLFYNIIGEALFTLFLFFLNRNFDCKY